MCLWGSAWRYIQHWDKNDATENHQHPHLSYILYILCNQILSKRNSQSSQTNLLIAFKTCQGCSGPCPSAYSTFYTGRSTTANQGIDCLNFKGHYYLRPTEILFALGKTGHGHQSAFIAATKTYHHIRNATSQRRRLESSILVVDTLHGGRKTSLQWEGGQLRCVWVCGCGFYCASAITTPLGERLS